MKRLIKIHHLTIITNDFIRKICRRQPAQQNMETTGRKTTQEKISVTDET